MPRMLEGRAREILEAPNCVVVSVPRRDVSVQSVVVWADLDGDNVRLNSAIGRRWPANLQRARRATVLAMNSSDPYEWVSVEAELIAASTDGADEHIDRLAKKYRGLDSYQNRKPGERRISFTLRPTRVTYRPPS